MTNADEIAAWMDSLDRPYNYQEIRASICPIYKLLGKEKLLEENFTFTEEQTPSNFLKAELLWQQDESCRSFDLLVAMSESRHGAIWDFFGPDGQHLPDSKLRLLVGWKELTMDKEQTTFPPEYFIPFTQWVKKHITIKALHQGLEDYFSIWPTDWKALATKYPEYLRKKTLFDLIGEFGNDGYGLTPIISDRLGGINIDSRFIRKMDDYLSKQDEANYFYELLGLFKDEGDQRQHFKKPLSIDIGTDFLNLSEITSKQKIDKIKKSELRNIGLYDLKDGGNYITPKKSSEMIEELRERLADCDLLIGYNLWDFDLEVLKAHGLDIEKEYPHIVIFDIFRAIYGKHTHVRMSLKNLLISNGLSAKDGGSNRNKAAMNDAKAALGCFLLLTCPDLGLEWKDVKLRTDIFEGLEQLRSFSEILADRNSIPVKLRAWIAEV
jgi:hypothetical protein